MNVNVHASRSLPVFTMFRGWIDGRLSLAAVGLLARLSECQSQDGKPIDFDSYASAGEDVCALLDELVEVGIIRGNELVDPAYEEYLLTRPPADSVPTFPLPSRGVVYYFRRADGAIKIGTSTQVGRRLDSLETVYGALEVLATEPGGRPLELERHAQFDQLRLPPDLRLQGGTEWFRPGAALLRHVAALAAVAA